MRSVLVGWLSPRCWLFCLPASLLLAYGLSPQLSPAPAKDAPAELTLDASRSAGEIRPLHGVNGGPLDAGGTLDLSDSFKEIAPPLVRLHDCHWPNPDVVDVHVVFPDFKADPEKAESYDFARTDEYVKAVLDSGSGIVFRLGESIEHHKVKRHVHPPKDPAKWAAVCVGIIRHYTEEWANGFRYKVRHWEVWNEPDNRPAMWTGTDEDYFKLYGVTAKAIKKKFPDLLVGGPGLGNTGRLKGDELEPSPFLKAFLARCKKDDLPLDFFSWHVYTDDPEELPRRARAVRKLLDGAGFKKTESHLNEWNYLPGGDWSGMLSKDPRARRRWHERVGGAEGAAFAAASLILLQDAPLDAANYFSAEPQGMGLFDCHGGPKKSFYALKAFKVLADAPLRLPLKGDLPQGAAACAGKSKAGDEVIVLFSKHRGPAKEITLAPKDLPWKGPSRFEVLRVDAERDLAPVRDGRLVADEKLTLDLRAPSVTLIRLRPDKQR